MKRLAWWAEHQFRLLKPIPEGGTLGDAFRSYRRQTGRAHPDERQAIAPPDGILYLYDWFWEIAQGRLLGPEGIQMPISNLELRAWCDLRQITLEPFELAGLRALDAAYLRVASEKVS